MKCTHCGVEMDNPMIFHIHENNCLEHQKQNGLLKEPKQEGQSIDYDPMTLDQLKGICKDNNLEGYTGLNKDDLIKFVKENVK